jgi:hypothetical protein
MYYAKVIDGKFVSRVNVADEAVGVTFTEEPTAEQLAPFNVVIVNDPPTMPTFDPTTHGVADTDPTLGDDGKWYANYVVVERGPEPTPLPGMPQP